MKTKLIVLRQGTRPYFISNALSIPYRDGSIRYIGYCVQNLEAFNFIGDAGTENYFHIK
jgi:hypothetical protein